MAVLKTLAGISYRFFGSKKRGVVRISGRGERMKNDSGSVIKNHAVVAHQEWLAARMAFLAKEKEFTRLQDQLNQGAARVAVGGGPERGCLRGTGWKTNPGGDY